MERFSEMTYVRPDLAAIKQEYQEYIQKLTQAASYEEMRDLYLAQKESELGWRTQMTIVSIRNTVDTRDTFYEGEMKYFDQEIPSMRLMERQAEKVILCTISDGSSCRTTGIRYATADLLSLQLPHTLRIRR